MANNIEIKAKVNDFETFKAAVCRISDQPCVKIEQEDTFFHSPKGRLKLRKLTDKHGQLVYYEREDSLSPTNSFYLISETNEPDTLTKTLASALGIRGIVKKTRYLYMVENTRIHLDQVEGLGDYMELEVVLGENDSPKEGQLIAEVLMKQLRITQDDLIKVAYIDLLENH